MPDLDFSWRQRRRQVLQQGLRQGAGRDGQRHANGTWVQTWEDVDGESQLWKLVTVSPTYKKIVNVMADKALDIVDMSDEDGAPAQIWESVDGEGQQWKFVSTAPKAATKTVRKPAAKKAPRRSPPPRGAAPPRPPRPRRRLP